MTYTMSGSPHKKGTIEGTSAFKQENKEDYGDAPRKDKKNIPERPGPGYSYVHRYWKEGTGNTVPWKGHGPGRGDLMPGFPRWMKTEK